MLDWSPILLTMQLALIVTIILLVIAIPLAYWLCYAKTKIKPLVETLVSMPLILPPTVLGYYLLIAFSPNNAFGRLIENLFGIKLIFSFEGLIMASIIYSLPFMVQPILSGFKNLPVNLIDAAYVLGSSRIKTLYKILLPNIKTSILTGIVLTFAHTIGEFGVVLMIGGNIPDKTRVASIAIYDEVETLNYAAANTYSLILFTISFITLLLVYLINGGYLTQYFHDKS